MKKSITLLTILALVLAFTLTACNEKSEPLQSSQNSNGVTADNSKALSNETETPVYIPLWMQPFTVIVYDENLNYTIIQGGELSESDLEGRDDIESVGLTTTDPGFLAEPNIKVEYDLHGFHQNTYYLVPGTSGEYQLSPPSARETSSVAAQDLSPLELLGEYRVTEDGDVLITYPRGEVEFAPDVYREYFFGTWYGDKLRYYPQGDLLIIDDSEKRSTPMPMGYIQRIGENVIAVSFTNGGLGDVYWLDTTKPDIIYHVNDVSGYDGEFDLAGNVKYTVFDIFTKTDAPVNQPENGFLSRLRISEICVEYNINSYLFTELSYETEDGIVIFMDDYYFSRAIYLVSEEKEKFVLSAALYGEYSGFDEETGSSYIIASGDVDVTYTLEKIGGEWERSVEFNQEQIEKIRTEYKKYEGLSMEEVFQRQAEETE